MYRCDKSFLFHIQRCEKIRKSRNEKRRSFNARALYKRANVRSFCVKRSFYHLVRHLAVVFVKRKNGRTFKRAEFFKEVLFCALKQSAASLLVFPLGIKLGVIFLRRQTLPFIKRKDAVDEQFKARPVENDVVEVEEQIHFPAYVIHLDAIQRRVKHIEIAHFYIGN